MLVLILLMLLVSVWDTNHFVKRSYQMKSDRIKGKVKIIVASDLHNHSFGRGNVRLLQAIDEQKPDLVLMTGDILTGNQHSGYENAAEFVQKVAAKYPVYYANGNHESKLARNEARYQNKYSRYCAELKSAGVEPMRNIKRDVPEQEIEIFGLELPQVYYHKGRRRTLLVSDLNGLLGRPDPHKYTILLAHNPEHLETYAKWGADLVLSGHVHGGIMRLPLLGGVISPSYQLFPKYDGGLFTEQNAKMILSRGLGTHTIPVRFFNPAELVIVELTGQDFAPQETQIKMQTKIQSEIRNENKEKRHGDFR